MEFHLLLLNKPINRKFGADTHMTLLAELLN